MIPHQLLYHHFDKPLFPVPKGIVQYAVQINPLNYDSISQHIWPMALPESLTHAAPKRKALFLMGRYCASQALNQAGYQGKIELPIGPKGEPLWPPGWVGSITHTNDFIAAAVASQTDCHSIGIDTENLLLQEQVQSIGKTIATAEEIAQEKVQVALGLTPSHYYSLLFSAKESIYKCFYPEVQRFIGFQEVTIRNIQAESGHFQFQFNVNLNEEFTAAQLFSGRFWCGEQKIHTVVALYPK